MPARRTRLTAALALLVGAVAAGGAIAAHGSTSTAAPAGGIFAVARSASGGPPTAAEPERSRHGHGLAAAATYLGLTEAELRSRLDAGKTPAQIAQATDGKTVDGLVAALVAAEKQELAAAVTAGQLTHAQADSIAASLVQRVTERVNSLHERFGRHFGHGGPGGHLAAAERYLGLTAAQLRTQLDAGKTLAQIAQAADGKTVDGLVAALLGDEHKELASAVAAGHLSQAQADALEQLAKARFTDLVNGTFPPPGRDGGFGGGHHHGPPPPGAAFPAPAGASL